MGHGVGTCCVEGYTTQNSTFTASKRIAGQFTLRSLIQRIASFVIPSLKKLLKRAKDAALFHLKAETIAALPFTAHEALLFKSATVARTASHACKPRNRCMNHLD